MGEEGQKEGGWKAAVVKSLTTDTTGPKRTRRTPSAPRAKCRGRRLYDDNPG